MQICLLFFQLLKISVEQGPPLELQLINLFLQVVNSPIDILQFPLLLFDLGSQYFAYLVLNGIQLLVPLNVLFALFFYELLKQLVRCRLTLHHLHNSILSEVLLQFLVDHFLHLVLRYLSSGASAAAELQHCLLRVLDLQHKLAVT